MRWPSPASAISMCSPAILCANSSSSISAGGRVGLSGDVGNQSSREAARGVSCCCCPSQGASCIRVLPWPLASEAGEAVVRRTFRTAGGTLCSRRSTGSWRPCAACEDKRRRQRGIYAGMQRWADKGRQLFTHAGARAGEQECKGGCKPCPTHLHTQQVSSQRSFWMFSIPSIGSMRAKSLVVTSGIHCMHAAWHQRPSMTVGLRAPPTTGHRQH